MIAVSNEFKKAIKNAERKIKGYVEVLYDVKTPTINTSSNMTSDYTNISNVASGGRVKQNYGTIDYLPLDGSYLTMDVSDNTNSGFISNELSGAETGRTITLSFASTTLNGITIYYKNNLPEGAYLTLSDGTTATIPAPEDNGSGEYMQQYIFSSPKTLTSITIEYNLWRYETRKVRIPRIDLGLSAVYKDQDLIEFTVDEEVNKLVEEVPINETNVTINNMYNLFNPLNPQGVVKYLTDGSKIIPYIGVLTETQGVEYVKMGDFFFDSYTNNSDKTTTLVGKNIIKKLESESLKDDNNTQFFTTVFDENDFTSFMGNYNYTFVKNWNNNGATVMWREDSLLKLLKDLAFWQTNLFYANRNSVLTFKNVNTTIKETLTKSELLNDVEYKKIDKLNTLNIIKNTYTAPTGGSSQTSNFLQETVTLKKTSEVFLIKSQNPNMMFATVSQSGGTGVSIISAGFFSVFVRVTGTVGANVILTFNGYTGQSISEKTFSKQESGTTTPNILEFNSDIYYVVNDTVVNNRFGVIDKAPSYEINFEYNGDPSLEAGDYINVETPYGYKPVFIQKNTFRFNGGLSGSIEGVE